MRVLVVEDDSLLGEGLRAGLAQAGYAADWVTDGEAAELALAGQRYDVVVLDIGLPKVDGLTLLKALRAAGNAVPVLILTARDAVQDRVAGLHLGADDYLVKPFALAELTARLMALIRRARGVVDPTVRVGRVALDPAARRVTLDDRPVELSSREFATLQELLLNAGRVLSKTQLEDRLFGWGEETESNVVEVYVHHLRRKLYPELIRTIRGAGYMIPKSGE